jgi:uncharacterized protein (DUF433 family)
MADAKTGIEHFYITKSPDIHGGEPIIKGTRFPVRSVVTYILRNGMLPEELVREFPQLTLSAVYDALAYYYDHKEEIDLLIEQQKETEWQKKAK